MNRERLVCAVVMTVVLAAVGIFTCLQNAGAQEECRVVKIRGGGEYGQGKLFIEPDLVTIPKDTCVVWLNRARTSEVRVKFADGKKCGDVTGAEVGFSLDSYNCFVTSVLSFGGTSSLNFLESGIFEYTVESEGGVKAKGKIVVE